jgi:hypothetical protein
VKEQSVSSNRSKRNYEFQHIKEIPIFKATAQEQDNEDNLSNSQKILKEVLEDSPDPYKKFEKRKERRNYRRAKNN